MDTYTQLINILRRFPSREWINRYFDLQKRILTELELENEDPRLSLSLTKNNGLPFNLGQRYVIKPYPNELIGIIVPAHFEEKTAAADSIFYFTTNKITDAKFLRLPLQGNTGISPILYDACIEACMNILYKTKKSGYRKFHEPLLYDFTMELSVRNELLDELNR